MSTNVQPAPTPQGLPPVQPPSGKHIVQMFLVPGTIVGVIVIGFLLFVWVFGGPRTPKQFLEKLDDSNEDVRWRTAMDLAQTLLRDEELAADAEFALQIAGRLENAVAANEAAEKRLEERLKNLKDRDSLAAEWKKIQTEGDWKTIQARRDYILYLTACAGAFTVPVGVPLLEQLA